MFEAPQVYPWGAFFLMDSIMPDIVKTLRQELEAEFACLTELGVTDEELEVIYEMCGLKPRRVHMLRVRHMVRQPPRKK